MISFCLHPTQLSIAEIYNEKKMGSVFGQYLGYYKRTGGGIPVLTAGNCQTRVRVFSGLNKQSLNLHFLITFE